MTTSVGPATSCATICCVNPVLITCATVTLASTGGRGTFGCKLPSGPDFIIIYSLLFKYVPCKQVSRGRFYASPFPDNLALVGKEEIGLPKTDNFYGNKV
jgi:hypothetical protein